MRRAYEILLRFYPRDFKAAFSCEMASAFERTAEERRVHGRAALARFALAELGGLFIGAAAEWLAKLRTDPSIRGRTLPDRLLMRPPGVSWNDYYGLPAPVPMEVAEAQQRTEFLVNRIVYAIAHHDFERARTYSYQECEARENLRQLRAKYNLSEPT